MVIEEEFAEDLEFSDEKLVGEVDGGGGDARAVRAQTVADVVDVNRILQQRHKRNGNGNTTNEREERENIVTTCRYFILSETHENEGRYMCVRVRLTKCF